MNKVIIDHIKQLEGGECILENKVEERIVHLQKVRERVR